MAPDTSKNRAVILIGGGFAGLTTALSLSQCKPKPPIILIEQRSRFVFSPLLYELLSGELQLWEIAPEYRSLLSHSGIVLLQDKVTSINTKKRSLRTNSGLDIEYSQLVIGTGSSSNDFGIPGVKQNTMTFQSLKDVEVLKAKINEIKNHQEKSNLIGIVGAGPTGVELSCKVADILDGQGNIHLIDLGDRILPNSKSFNQEQAEKALIKKGINIHLNTKVTRIGHDKIDLIKNAGNNFCESELTHNGVIWATGIRPNIPLFEPEGDLKKTQTGHLSINSFLQVEGLDNVLALGDASSNINKPLPSTAQVAIQQGESAAKIVMALRMGQTPEPFEFQDRGEMLSLGIEDATLTGLGLTIAGPLAFKIRRMAYLARLPGLSLGLKSAGAWLAGL